MRFFLVLAFVVAAAATVDTKDDEKCNNILKELVQECKQYVMFPSNPKIDPSEACCTAVQKADIPCLCSKVTKDVEKLVCMEKVVYVAKFCKNPLTSGSKCGSKCFVLTSMDVFCTNTRYIFACYDLCMTCVLFSIISAGYQVPSLVQ